MSACDLALMRLRASISGLGHYPKRVVSGVLSQPGKPYFRHRLARSHISSTQKAGLAGANNLPTKTDVAEHPCAQLHGSGQVIPRSIREIRSAGGHALPSGPPYRGCRAAGYDHQGNPALPPKEKLFSGLAVRSRVICHTSIYRGMRQRLVECGPSVRSAGRWLVAVAPRRRSDLAMISASRPGRRRGAVMKNMPVKAKSRRAGVVITQEMA
jgi:hypothetical protein